MDIMRYLTAGYGTLHPECEEGEVFICYERRAETSSMDIPGKRLGTRVFDNAGTEVTAIAIQRGIVPVFANEVEHRKRYRA